MKMIRTLEVTPEALIAFLKAKDLSGATDKITFQVIENPLPPDAEFVGMDFNPYRHTQFLKIESEQWTEGGPLKPPVFKRFHDEPRQD